MRADAARGLGIDVRDLTGSAPVTIPAPATFTEPDLERRAAGIQFSNARYRIVAEARPLGPEVDVYTAAPTVRQAEQLADATIAAARRHLHELTVQAGLDPSRELVVRQLGPARGATLASHTGLLIGLLTFLVTFAIALGHPPRSQARAYRLESGQAPGRRRFRPRADHRAAAGCRRAGRASRRSGSHR